MPILLVVSLHEDDLSTMDGTDRYSIQHPDRFLPDYSACNVDQAHQTGDRKQDRCRFLTLFEYHVRFSQSLACGIES